MGNIIDYVREETRGFDERPFGDVDALVLASVAYQKLPPSAPRLSEQTERYGTFWKRLKAFWRVPFEGPTLSEVAVELTKPDGEFTIREGHTGLGDPELDEQLFEALVDSPRFGDIRVGAYEERFSEAEQTQFAAETMLLPDRAGTIVVAFRGTDDSFAGWKEDFNMSFQYPVPAQESAMKYTTAIAGLWRRGFGHMMSRIFGQGNGQKFGQEHPLILTGHSKGGNVAVYAAMNADEKIRKRITRAYSLDGPGFPSDVVNSAEYAAVTPKVEKIVPDSSIVGMILETPEPCTVVVSDQKGIMQHLTYSWQLNDRWEFERLPHVSSSSQYFNTQLNAWLSGLTVEQREHAVDALFSLLGASGSDSLSGMMKTMPRAIPDIINSYVGLSDEDRRNLRYVFNLLLKTSLARGK
ncbi:DUF2974 domain-containing protein [Bifidobacterium callimiconis]|uniref:DUF2974 domain-containing protein n=1 Tax=Bifidobacterium callimiconis TaxID=2306973 RepID=A0A430F829_9BIFI|nr:DUF2974 domain-containing protein [Bifidobacterium callimiconis]MBT1178086.1 DUF2974 domain-containing protein [Bifidobacterium callimiconis]RSX49002.1 hypothetical protein D2E23_2153 [Bifidobacterium callimiconis]